MESEIIIFQEVQSVEEAADIEALLIKNNIFCKIVETAAVFDAATGLSYPDRITVQIHASDFEKARKILIQSVHPDEISDDNTHYFHDYSDEELIEVLKTEDDWSPEDIAFARKLLSSRNVRFDESDILAANEKRRNDKDLPAKVAPFYLILGFLIALLGGLLGIMLGLFVALSRKNDRFGNKIYSYDESSRTFGKIIFATGLAVVFFLLYNMYIK